MRAGLFQLLPHAQRSKSVTQPLASQAPRSFAAAARTRIRCTGGALLRLSLAAAPIGGRQERAAVAFLHRVRLLLGPQQGARLPGPKILVQLALLANHSHGRGVGLGAGRWSGEEHDSKGPAGAAAVLFQGAGAALDRQGDVGALRCMGGWVGRSAAGWSGF